MAKAETRTLLVAVESWDGALDGATFKGVRGATIVWSDHPAARKWPGFFTPVTPTHETRGVRIEAATANPGEERD